MSDALFEQLLRAESEPRNADTVLGEEPDPPGSIAVRPDARSATSPTTVNDADQLPRRARGLLERLPPTGGIAGPLRLRTMPGPTPTEPSVAALGDRRMLTLRPDPAGGVVDPGPAPPSDIVAPPRSAPARSTFQRSDVKWPRATFALADQHDERHGLDTRSSSTNGSEHLLPARSTDASSETAPSRRDRRLAPAIGSAPGERHRTAPPESRRSSSAIVAQADDAIWTTDDDGTVLTANDREQYASPGLATDEQCGVPISDMLSQTEGEALVLTRSDVTAQSAGRTQRDRRRRRPGHRRDRTRHL